MDWTRAQSRGGRSSWHIENVFRGSAAWPLFGCGCTRASTSFAQAGHLARLERSALGQTVGRLRGCHQTGGRCDVGLRHNSEPRCHKSPQRSRPRGPVPYVGAAGATKLMSEHDLVKALMVPLMFERCLRPSVARAVVVKSLARPFVVRAGFWNCGPPRTYGGAADLRKDK